MDLGEIWSKIKDFLGDVVDYFKNFKASGLFKFGDMIYAFALLIIAIMRIFT